jgi:hypothetical protein
VHLAQALKEEEADLFREKRAKECAAELGRRAWKTFLFLFRTEVASSAKAENSFPFSGRRSQDSEEMALA